MFKTILITFSIFTFTRLFAQDTSTETIARKLDEYLLSANAVNKFNGAALVAKKGEILLSKAYGFKNTAKKLFDDTATIFQIGSITKSFTAIVIAKLQEQGKLSVNDKLSKYFPGYPNGDKITIQNLLTHTSGIYNYTNDIGEEDTAIVCYPVSQQRVLEVFENRPLSFKPGKSFEYCNSGYYLLGMIIEKVSGKKYEDVVREMIFNPTGMSHSGFDFKNLTDTNKAQGYIILDKDTTKPNYTVDSTVYFSAGSIYSTTNDLYRWSRAISTNKLLNKNSWTEVFTPYKNDYGYGFYIDTLFGKNYIKHDGGLLGFASSFTYYPEDDVTIILLTNVGNYGNSMVPVTMGILSILFHLPYSNWVAENQSIKVGDSILQRYVGVYTLDGKTKITISVAHGQLYAEGNSKKSIPRVPIYPISETKFLLKDFNAVFEFIKGEDDRFTKFISHENGKNVELKRVK